MNLGISGGKVSQLSATGSSSMEKVEKSSTSDLNGKNTVHKRKAREIDLTYCEYNLSTMKDSKGGFIIQDSTESPYEQKQTEKRLKAESERKSQIEALQLDPTQEYNCRECESIDVDPNYIKYYNIQVCRACRDKFVEKYSLLTKTECKEDYLLTESELRDHEKLPVWIKQNPHKSSWSNMLLYMREQVEEFAWTKWKSPELLDAEFERRENEKKLKKEKKFKKKLVELRKKTRTSTWLKPQSEVHDHDFEDEEDDSGRTVQICKTCGMTVDVEIF